MSAAWVGAQRILCHDKWGDANGELEHMLQSRVVIEHQYLPRLHSAYEPRP